MGRQVADTFVGWEPSFFCCDCIGPSYDDEHKYEGSGDEEKQSLLEKEPDHSLRPDAFLVVTHGSLSSSNIIDAKRRKNSLYAWIIRIIGFILMCSGLYFLFQPLLVLLKVIPFIANIVSVGVFFVAFLTSLVLTLVIVSLAWVVARPLLVTLLVGTGVGIFVLFSKVKA